MRPHPRLPPGCPQGRPGGLSPSASACTFFATTSRSAWSALETLRGKHPERHRARPPCGSRARPVERWVSRSLLTAGQLLAQSLQCLVGGQRDSVGGAALGLALGRAAGAVRRGLARLDLGLLGLGLLLDVSLPARVRLGVLVLPDLALVVEALEPLARVGVEALRVDVVALLVVRRGHAVERRVELLALHRGRGLVGLLQRQRDPATL